MIVSLLTPEKKMLEAVEVVSVSIPTSEGEIQILEGHAPLIGTLATGAFTLRAAKAEWTGFISHGYFRVVADRIEIFPETCEFSKDIDLKRAKEAEQKSQKALMDPATDPNQLKKYELKLQRALSRQQEASRFH